MQPSQNRPRYARTSKPHASCLHLRVADHATAERGGRTRRPNAARVHRPPPAATALPIAEIASSARGHFRAHRPLDSDGQVSPRARPHAAALKAEPASRHSTPSSGALAGAPYAPHHSWSRRHQVSAGTVSPSRFFKLRPFCRPGTDPGRTWPGAALRGALCCGSEPAQSDPALLTARAARIILFCGRADRPYPSDRLTGRNLKPVPHPDGPAGNGRHHEGSPRSPSPAGPLCSRANRWRAAASRRRRPGPSDAAPSTIGSPGPPGRPLRARGRRMSKTLGRPARPGHRGVGRRWRDGLDHVAVPAAGAGGRGRRPGRDGAWQRQTSVQAR